MLRHLGFACLLATSTACIMAETDQPESALKRADRLSSVTGRGATPFHLKMTVSEPANPQSPYTASIEELWLSANDWTRTVETPDLRQQITVIAGKRDEQNLGSYYPLWLRSFVTAAINPLEDSNYWEQVSARIVQTTSTNGHPSSTCARAQFKIGKPSATNDAFAVICFNADGTLSSVVRPGYDMEFKEPQSFGKKLVATRYIDNIEPGTELVGHVDLLEPLNSKSGLPALPPLGSTSTGSIKSVPIKQETLEGLAVASTAITWPPVHSGNTTGKLSMYVSTDRDGHIREAYPLNSDNAGLQDAARDQLLKWKLRPAVVDGQPVQTESALTFAFDTSIGANTAPAGGVQQPPATPSAAKPIIVSQAIASSLRTTSYAPVYPQNLREGHVSGSVVLKAVIGKEGRITSLTPISSTLPEFTQAAIAAVQQWRYKPYLLNGLPIEIETTITVNFAAR